MIIGGGPAGYEAALVAAQLGAEVTVVEADGAGGACVLSDCVPSKTFIASSDVVTAFRHGGSLGVRMTAPGRGRAWTPPPSTPRVKRLALAQSADIAAKLAKAGVELVARPGPARRATRSGTPHPVVVDAGRRRAVHGRRRPRSSSPPAPHPRVLPDAAARTASGSSPGARSTTCPSCRST